jgi:hypothetical protein
MNQQPSPSTESRPAGNQFSLRGLFILMTALSLILALLALAIREPLHWLGTIFVVGFCFLVIAALEGLRKLFPPQPQRIYYEYHAIQAPTAGANAPHLPGSRDGVNPFGVPPSDGTSPFALRDAAESQDECGSD